MSDPKTPDSELNMGTTMVGGPVDSEPDDRPIDPDTGQPAEPSAP